MTTCSSTSAVLQNCDSTILGNIAEHLQPREMAALAATCRNLHQRMNHCTVDASGKLIATGVITMELRRRLDPGAHFNVVTSDKLTLLVQYSDYSTWLRAHQALDEPSGRDVEPYMHLLAFPHIQDEELEQIIRAHPSIKTLDLSLCKELTQAGLVRILSSALTPDSQGLEHLDMSSKVIDNARLEQIIRAHPHLKSLYVCLNEPAPVLANESLLRHLEHLNLSTMMINEEQFKQIIRAHPRLKSLKLRHCELSGEALAHILSAAQGSLDLEYLDLSWKDINDAQLEQIIRAHPHLKSLIIAFCRNLTGKGLVPILSAAQSPLDLAYLDLSSIHIHDAQLEQIIGMQPHLKSLCLADCRKLTPNGLTHLLSDVSKLRCLEHLALSPIGIDDAQLEQIVRAHPRLKSLKIAGCPNLTGNGITHLLGAASLPDLEHLTLGTPCSGRCAINAAQLEQIIKGCPSLKSLFLGAGPFDHLTPDLLQVLECHRNLRVILPTGWLGHDEIFAKDGLGHFGPYNFVERIYYQRMQPVPRSRFPSP